MSRRRDPACLVCHAETGLETVTDYPDGWRGLRSYVCSRGPTEWTTCQLVLLRRETMAERRALQDADARLAEIVAEDAARLDGIVAEGAAHLAAIVAESEERAEARRPRGKSRAPRGR